MDQVDQANQHHPAATDKPAISNKGELPQINASWTSPMTQAITMQAPKSQNAAAARRMDGKPPEPDHRAQVLGFIIGCGAMLTCDKSPAHPALKRA